MEALASLCFSASVSLIEEWMKILNNSADKMKGILSVIMRVDSQVDK